MRLFHAWMGCVSLMLPTLLRAQTEAEVVYDHYAECKNKPHPEDGCTINVSRRLDPGGTLKITVNNTRRAYFDVTVRGYAVRSDTTKQVDKALAEALEKDPHETIAKELTHNPKYGGYIVTISPIHELPPETPPNDPTQGEAGAVKMPGPAVIVVTIDAEDPPYAFSGGLSLTSLRSQAFVARPSTGGVFTIMEDPARRDAGTVGFATFVNVRISKKADWFWPGMGIGLETDGNTQYYFGLGVRLVKGIFFTTGAVLGQVASLPAGLQLNDTISDPNKLASLDKRRKFGLYAGMSFRFLGGGQTAFGKPFVGGEGK